MAARLLSRAGADPTRTPAPSPARLGALAVVLAVALAWAGAAEAQPLPPPLTQPVNDFAHVVDADSARTIDGLIRALVQASGDVVVVATVDTFQPYATIDDYAVKMFENGGRGIGQKGRDNGLLIVVAVKDRRVKVETGYELEQFVTDGFAGETSREVMAPEFGRGNYGAGLVAGVRRIVGRIADGRNVSLQGVRATPQRTRSPGTGRGVFSALFVLFIVINAIVGAIRRGSGRGRRSSWSGWSSGVGPFIGGRGGFGGGGGGFGGGFGGFGGGRSGGGGGGAGW